MHITLYSLIITVIAMVSMAVRIRRFLSGEQAQSWFKLLTVIGVWMVVLLAAVAPELTLDVSRRLGLGGDAGMIVLLGFIIVFLIIFRLLSIIERIERNITELVRQDALRSITSDTKRSA